MPNLLAHLLSGGRLQEKSCRKEQGKAESVPTVRSFCGVNVDPSIAGRGDSPKRALRVISCTHAGEPSVGEAARVLSQVPTGLSINPCGKKPWAGLKIGEPSFSREV